jgi:hypothetical protein
MQVVKGPLYGTEVVCINLKSNAKGIENFPTLERACRSRNRLFHDQDSKKARNKPERMFAMAEKKRGGPTVPAPR